MNRRNGKLKSCEPCRKSKIRCDHTLPTCEKCRHRGFTDRCFYHPAPMTRLRGEAGSTLAGRRDSAPAIRTTDEISHDRGQAPHIPSSALPQQVNFKKASDFASDITGDEHHQSYAASGRLSEVLSCPRLNMLSVRECILPDELDVETGRRLLTLLHPFSLIEKQIRENIESRIMWTVSTPMLLGALPHVRSIVEQESCASGGAANDALFKKITENSLRPLEVPASCTAWDFLTLYTGNNLRWEFVGYLLAYAGRGAISKPSNATIWISDRGEKVDRATFCHKMMVGSRTCIELCRQNGTEVNDIHIWHLWENLVFSTAQYGDSSPLVWQRLGDLSTDVFAMGLHREEQPDETPFFLKEIRRKMFARVYNIDKALATYVGLPPRVPKRYVNVQLPLDISDETLMTEGPQLENLLDSVDPNGWNTERTFHRAGLMRMRSIMSLIREEILEISLGNEDKDTVRKLHDISDRCQSAWESFPEHLRYHPQIWENLDSPREALILHSLYLEQLNSEFHINRLLIKYSADACLIVTSMQMLRSVMVLIKQHSSLHENQWELGWMVLFYGVSSAGVLAAELNRCIRACEPLPSSISRSEVIRNLSVLISFLEWAIPPGDGNFKACNESSRMLARILDEALDPKPVSVSDGTPQSVSHAPGNEAALGSAEEQFMLEPNGNESLPIDSEAFLDWFDSVDWNNPMGF